MVDQLVGASAAGDAKLLGMARAVRRFLPDRLGGAGPGALGEERLAGLVGAAQRNMHGAWGGPGRLSLMGTAAGVDRARTSR